MKKRLITFLCLTLLAVGGVVVYEQVLLGRLATTLEEQTALIGAGYQSLITKNLNPLATEYEMDDQQRRVLKRIKEFSTSLETSESLEEKIQHISMLQVALVSFVKSVTAEQAFIKDPNFVYIQKEMGERGDMRELLSNYNTTALRWNNTVQSDVGSLTSQIEGSDRNLLPYLRFDGEQEFVTIVEL